jgi:hypothetical protein
MNLSTKTTENNKENIVNGPQEDCHEIPLKRRKTTSWPLNGFLFRTILDP